MPDLSLTDQEILEGLGVRAPAAPTDEISDDQILRGVQQAGPEPVPTEIGESARAAGRANADDLLEPAPVLQVPQAQDALNAAPILANPQTLDESLVNWRAQGHDFRYTPFQRQGISELVDGYTWNFAVTMGLADSAGRRAPELTNELFADIRAAYLHTIPAFYAPMSREDQRKVSGDALRGLLGHIQTETAAKLRAFEGRKLDAAEKERQRTLQHMFAEARAFTSRADEPRIQDTFMYYAGKAIDAQRSREAEGSDVALELGLDRGLLTDGELLREIVSKELDEGGVQAVNGLAFRIEDLIKGSMTQIGDAFGPEAAMAAAMQGSLRRHRAGLLGLQGELGKVSGIGNSIVMARPELANRVLGASAAVGARKKLGLPIEMTPGDELLPGISAKMNESLPSLMDRMFGFGASPLLELSAMEVAADPKRNNIATRWDSIVQAWVGPAFEAAIFDLPGAVIDLVEEQLPESGERQEYAGHLLALAGPAGMRQAYNDVRAAQEDFELALDDLEAGRGTLTAREVADLQDRAWWMHESLFNPEANFTGSLAAVVGTRSMEDIMESVGELGLSRRVLKNIMRGSITEKVNAVPLTNREALRKRLEESTARTSRSIQKAHEKNAFAIGPGAAKATLTDPAGVVQMWSDVVENAVLRTYSEAVELFGFVAEDPEKGAQMAVAMMGMKGMVTAARPLRRRALDYALNGSRTEAMAKTIRNAVAADRPAAEHVLQHIRELPLEGKPARIRKNMERLQANLETITQNHKDNPVAVAFGPEHVGTKNVVEFSHAAVEAEKRLRKLGPDKLGDLLTGIGVDETTWASIMHTGIGGLLGRFGNKIKLATVGEDFEVPRFIGQKDKPIATEIVQQMNEGNDIPDFGELPLSFDSLELAGTPQRIRLRRFLQATFPNADKFLGSQRGLVPKLGQFYSNFAQELKAYRALVSEKFTDIDDFLQTHVNRKLVELRTALVAARLDPNDVTIAARDRLIEQVRDRKNQRDMIGATAWDSGVRVSDIDWVKKGVDFEEVYLWARRRRGDDDLFLELADEGESFEDFQARLRTIMSRDFAEPDVKRSLDAQAARLKNAMMARYLHAPGLNDSIIIDTETGSALLGEQARRLRRRREKERADFDSEDVFENYGIQQIDGVKKLWEDMIRLAKLERTAKGGRPGPDGKLYKAMATRTQDLGKLPLSQMHKQMTEWEIQLKHNLGIDEHRARAYNMALAKLTADERRELDGLITRWQKSGQFDNFDQFRKQFPEVAALFPRNGDEAIAGLVKHSENFRHHLIDLWGVSQGLSKGWDRTREYLLRPYLPQRYMQFEFDQFFPQSREKKATRLLSPEGIDRGFTLPQADVASYKAIVNQPGGGTMSRIFDSQDEAVEWVGKRFGGTSSKDADPGLGGIRGTTGIGGSYSVLDPIGRDRARDLGLFGPTKGMADRFRGMVRNIYKQNFMQTLDRPGWAFDEEQWTNHLNTAAGEVDQRKGTFIKLDDDPRFGPLAGKRVHHRLVRDMLEFEDAFTAAETAAEAAKLLAQNQTVLTSILTSTPSWLRKAGSIQKALLVTNHITRNFKVIAHNVLGDHALFGPGAVGDGFNLNPMAWSDKGAALVDLKKYIFDGELTDELKGAMQAGAVDDFASLGIVSPDDARAFNRLFFDKDNPLPDKLKGFVRSLGHEGDAWKALETLLGARHPETPRIQALRREAQRLEEVWRRNSRFENGQRVANPDTLTPDELNDLVRRRNFLQDEVKRLVEPGKAQRLGNAMSTLWSFMTGSSKGIMGDVARFSAKLYQLVNNHARVSAYYYARRRLGWDPEFAVSRINTFMQTYSQVPRAVRSLSRGVLTNPVLSFPYEAARISKNLFLHQWARFAAWMLGTTAFNFVHLALAGHDPFTVAETLKAQSPTGFSSFYTGTVVLPKGDGSFDTMWIPALNPLTWFRFRSSPLYADLAADTNEQASGAERVFDFLGTAAFSSIIGNPITDAIAGTAQKKNPANGRPVDTRFEAVWQGFQHMLAGSVPSETPFVGSYARSIADSQQTPPYALTDRRVALSQKVIGLFTGIHFRGQLATGSNSTAFGRTIAQMSGAWLRAGREEFPELPRSIDYRDFLAHLMLSSGFMDRGADVKYRAQPWFTQLKEAEARIARGDKSGEALRREALDKMIEIDKDLLAAHGVEVSEDMDFSQQERDAVERARRSFDFDATFQNASTPRQAFVLMAAAKAPTVPREVLSNLVELAIRTEKYRLRSPSDLEGLQVAETNVREYLLKERPEGEALKLMLHYHSALEYWSQVAEFKERKRTAQDETRAAIAEELEDGS